MVHLIRPTVACITTVSGTLSRGLRSTGNGDVIPVVPMPAVQPAGKSSLSGSPFAISLSNFV